jgi:hypothetical protein
MQAIAGLKVRQYGYAFLTSIRQKTRESRGEDRKGGIGIGHTGQILRVAHVTTQVRARSSAKAAAASIGAIPGRG